MTKPDIVPASPAALSWQAEFRRAIRSERALRVAVGLAPLDTIGPSSDFPVLAPWPLVNRIKPAEPRDPIFLQLSQQQAEWLEQPGYVDDPLAETGSTQQPALIQKYAGRALLIATGACALHCRYCFRRSFPYAEHSGGQWKAALDYLAQQADIREVILSGGDPLSLDDDKLAALLRRLESIPHLQTLRIHTRWPIAIPQRVNPALLRTLADNRLQVVTVIHSNHAQEIDATVRDACAALGTVGQLLNQSVLLRGVNDNLTALRDLSEALLSAGALPYYLHQLDAVRGAAHFAVADDRARQLHAGLRQSLPGYLVPRLVREIPGELSKTPL